MTVSVYNWNPVYDWSKHNNSKYICWQVWWQKPGIAFACTNTVASHDAPIKFTSPVPLLRPSWSFNPQSQYIL